MKSAKTGNQKSTKIVNRVRVPLIQFYQNLPIRYKLMLVFNMVLIVSLVSLSYVNYRNSEETLTKKSTQYTQDILKMVEYRMKDYVRNLNLITQELISDNNLQGAGRGDSLQQYEKFYKIEENLRTTLFARDEVQSLALITPTHYVSADRNSKVANIKQLVSYSSEQYEKMLEEARKRNGMPIFYLDIEDGRAKNLFVARMAYSINTYEELGLYVILLRMEFLDSVLKDLVNEDTQNIMILSANNQIVVERDEAISDNIAAKMANVNGSKGWFYDESGESIVSYLIMDTKPNWKIISVVSLDSLYKDIHLLRQKIIFSSMAIVLVLSTISLLVTSDLTRPFNKLIQGMEKVRKGERNVQISLSRKDEIGYLGEAFNRMVKEMNTLSDWIYQEQLTRKEAEIKALQAQINPHFLFNTLESINWMALLNNVPEISEMVTSLSALMEASIGRDDKLITLQEELHYVDCYLLIIKKRFGERLELVKHIEPPALEVPIPRLLIQPLVENAIIHGIEKVQTKGVITLSATQSEGKLTISVEDNGEGIDEEELKIINESLMMNNDAYFKRLSAKKGKSVGLDNVNRRIKLFYGDEYGLSIESKAHVYTKVIVTIPVNVQNNPA